MEGIVGHNQRAMNDLLKVATTDGIFVPSTTSTIIEGSSTESEKRIINVKSLPTKLFPSGKLYFNENENGKKSKAGKGLTGEERDNVVVVHNNYINWVR